MWLFLLLMTLVALNQVPRLISRRDWRTLVAFGGVWVVATVYGALHFSDVHLPRAGVILVEIFGKPAK